MEKETILIRGEDNFIVGEKRSHCKAPYLGAPNTNEFDLDGHLIFPTMGLVFHTHVDSPPYAL